MSVELKEKILFYVFDFSVEYNFCTWTLFKYSFVYTDERKLNKTRVAMLNYNVCSQLV